MRLTTFLAYARVGTLVGALTSLTACYQGTHPFYDIAMGASASWITQGTNYNPGSGGADFMFQPVDPSQPPTYVPATYFGCGASTDPQIYYDWLSDRWFFTSFGDAICLAVSATGDPRGPYTDYQFPRSFFTPHDDFVDQPWITVTNNKVAITVQLYSRTAEESDGSATLVLNKGDVLTGSTVHTSIKNYAIKYYPAKSVIDDAPVYLVGPSNAGGLGTLAVEVITGVPGSGVNSAHLDVEMGFDVTTNPPLMPRPDGNHVRPALTVPTQQSAWNGTLWLLVNSLDSANAPSLSVAQLWNLAPTFHPLLFRAMHLSPPSPGGGFACHTLAVTDDDDVVIGFVSASPTTYATSYISGRRSYDPVLSLRAPVVAGAGNAPSLPDPDGYVERLDYCTGTTVHRLGTTEITETALPNDGDPNRVIIYAVDPYGHQ